MTTETRDELFRLLEALCEERLEESDLARLEELVLADPAARQMFIEYISLHGMLFWDATAESATVDVNSILRSGPVAVPNRRSGLWRTAMATAACLLVLGGAWFASRAIPPNGVPQGPIAHDNGVAPSPTPNGMDGGNQTAMDTSIANDLPKVRLSDAPSVGPVEPTTPPPPNTTAIALDRDVVGHINRLLEKSWTEAGVAPSPVADDAEWLRRVSLDLTGRIPDGPELDRFIAERSPNKRAAEVDRLLNDPAYARHFATVWTNLLVGRAPQRKIDRDGLAKFLRDQFWNSRPWTETVTELVAAEGSEKTNGAANFLLAHLNNQAVPATAITARIFLCEQVQCSQCHIHPIVKDWGQEQFWELNAFFQGTKLVERTEVHNDGRRTPVRELVSQPVTGPIYYETLNGVMRIAYPKFDGKELPRDGAANRRKELARLMSEGDHPQLAAAFVNRLWAQLFGYGFTAHIEDMGPHNKPSHPELLDYLTRSFVKSGYDVRQLLRWMCSSNLYQLSSRVTAQNAMDDPATGSTPMFSRMYVKPLSAEQLFDSLLVATTADRTASKTSREADLRRRDWLAQFYQALDNDENAESTTFDGSISQALVLMNGELMKEAISGRAGTFLNKVESEPGSDSDKLSKLSLAILARTPTPKEEAVFRQNVRTGRSSAKVQLHESLQDACWAYLNSTEFVVNR